MLAVAFLFCDLILVAHGQTNFNAVSKPSNLDWRSIESDDYRTYITNLQAAGCPTQTIRDIVTADVVAAFGVKRDEAIKARFKDYEFWKSNPAQTEARLAFESQREAIDADMGRVLQELLGPDTPLPDLGREWNRLELVRKLVFLSEDKRSLAVDILLKNQKVNDQIQKLAAGLNLSEDTNELQRILIDHDGEKAALKELLSTNEHQLVQMNTSWTSENLRRAMAHFEPTEKEFRDIFAAWLPHDEKLARLRANREEDPGNADVYAKIKERLTADRYQVYCDTWWK